MSNNEFLNEYNKVKNDHNKIEYAIVNTKYKPIEHQKYPGYFLIPDSRFSNYVVNQSGDVKQLIMTLKREIGESIFNYPSKQGYLINSVYNIEDKWFTVMNHILTCLALHGPKPSPDAQVNHHDGNKQNNHYSNLYWTDGELNVKHAFRTGLCNFDYSKIPVLLWDPLNDPSKNDIKEHESIRAASIAIGINFSSISTTLKLPKPRLINSRYIAKYKDDTTPWPTLEEVFSNSQTRPVFAFNITTGLVVHDITIKDLGKNIGVCPVGIRRHLTKESIINNTGWLFSYNRDEDWKALYDIYKNWYKESHKPFIVVDLNDNYQKYIDDMPGGMGSRLNIEPNTISKYLRNKWYQYKDYLIYYHEDNSDKLKEIKAKYNIK